MSSSPPSVALLCLLPLVFASPNHDELQADAPLHWSAQQYTSKQERRLYSIGTETCAQVYNLPLQPLRIGWEFIDVSTSSSAVQTFVNDVLMSEAAAYWMQALDVRRVSAPLRAERRCTVGTKLSWSDGVQESDYTCTGTLSAPTCNGNAIPSKFLKSRKLCTSRCAVGTDCPTSCDYAGGSCPAGCSEQTQIDFGSSHYLCEECTTEPDGAGADGYDTYIFVSIKDTSACGGATQAYAGSCVQDQCDRPIFGYINFCMSKVDIADTSGGQVATAIHELAHVLAFSSGLYKYFRNSDGTAKVPRDADDNLQGQVKWSCSGNQFTWLHESGTKRYIDLGTHGMIGKFSERGMDSCSCPISGGAMGSECLVPSAGLRKPSCVVKVIMPKVLEKVREHFNCDTLNGAELENQPTSECSIIGSHWEERIFLNELMAPVKVDVTRLFISNVTLALFEDSGWYVPQYSMADTLVRGVHWGYGEGCAFASDPCVSNGAISFTRNWCANGMSACCYDRSGECQCGVDVYSSAVPTQFQYFTDPHLGKMAETDYCPFYGVVLSNRVCTNTASIYDVASNANFMRESFGAGSRCLESTLHGDVTNSNGGTFTADPSDFEIERSGCYEIVCKAGDASYDVVIPGSSDAELLGTCTTAGQALTSGSLQGQVTCADPAVFCGVPPSKAVNVSLVIPNRSSPSYNVNPSGGTTGDTTTISPSGLVGHAADRTSLLLPLACLSLHMLLRQSRFA